MHSTALQQLQETSVAHAALLMQTRAHLAAFSHRVSGGLTRRIAKQQQLIVLPSWLDEVVCGEPACLA